MVGDATQMYHQLVLRLTVKDLCTRTWTGTTSPGCANSEGLSWEDVLVLLLPISVAKIPELNL